MSEQIALLRTHSLGVVRFLSKRHPAGQRIPRHHHENPYLCWVTRGLLREAAAGQSHACGPGSLLVNLEATPHENRIGDREARTLIVDLLGPISRPLPRLPFSHHASAPKLDIGNLERELRAPDDSTPIVVESLLAHWLDVLDPAGRDEAPGSSMPPWLRFVRERIDDEVPRVSSLAELAGSAGVHPDHLSRRFRSFLGQGPGEYMRTRRLEWARSALLSSHRPLAEIALDAGFSDQSHFTRAFRGAYGLPPGRFRRIHSDVH